MFAVYLPEYDGEKRALPQSFYQPIEIAGKLEALNPMSVISRGYSAAFGADGKLIKSIDDAEPGDELNLRLSDGIIIAKTLEKKENTDV